MPSLSANPRGTSLHGSTVRFMYVPQDEEEGCPDRSVA